MIDTQDRNYFDGQFKELRKNTDDKVDGLHTRINGLQKDTFSKFSKDRIKIAVIESNLNNHINPTAKCQKAGDAVDTHEKDVHKGSIMRVLKAIVVGSGAVYVLAEVLNFIINK